MALYLSEIVSVSGKSGLHKLVGKRPNGLIVESLDEAKKRFPTNITQKVSFLSDISMYTYDGDVKLEDVLKILHEKMEGGLAPVTKKNSGAEVQTFFRLILENYDEDQVYNSDILKLVSWYGILKDLVDFNNLTQEEDQDTKSETKTKKAAPKKGGNNRPASKAHSRAKGGSQVSSVRKTGG